jgi:hypothetical protein
VVISELAPHHLLEKRFAEALGQNARKMASIAVTPTEHQAFMNAWRKLIGYGAGTAGAQATDVSDAAKELYKDFPQILKALGLSKP